MNLHTLYSDPLSNMVYQHFFRVYFLEFFLTEIFLGFVYYRRVLSIHALYLILYTRLYSTPPCFHTFHFSSSKRFFRKDFFFALSLPNSISISLSSNVTLSFFPMLFLLKFLLCLLAVSCCWNDNTSP